jgi:penicillin-binding protein A
VSMKSAGEKIVRQTMNRRQAISVLLGSAIGAAGSVVRSLDRIIDPAHGCAALLDLTTGQAAAANSSPLLGRALFPPGSTLKPLTLSALLESGKLRADESFMCPERLTIAGRRMNCSHPRLGAPVQVDTALAYSCNCFVAHAAERFAPGELAAALRARGLASLTHLGTAEEVTGEVAPAINSEQQKLQALGESDVLVTPLGLASAYGNLARQLSGSDKSAGARKILAGLEGAVDFGTGQLARVPWATLAGKTGTTRHGTQFIAWFVGFVPSRQPKVAVAVMLAGQHGGSDAAPVARQILEAWKAGHV